MPGTNSARRDALPTGASLRGYTLEAVVGHGGFGIVYRAQHDELATTVAIKEYLPMELAAREGVYVRVRSDRYSRTYEDGLRRFRDEARALTQFQDHPGIVSCRDFFRANGTAYMVMEYEEGRSLAEVLAIREAAGEPFEEADLLGVMVPLLEGLQCVHEAGLLHRDIKPSNILIREADGHPVLIDFGASKQLVANQSKSMAPFTEGYAAMEQVADAGELGPWTDMYGVGAVMWRMVAGGQPPWEPPHPVRVESRSHAALGNLADPLPAAAQLGEGKFAPSVLDLIDGCLRIQEGTRIQNCLELLSILRGKQSSLKQSHSTSQFGLADPSPQGYPWVIENYEWEVRWRREEALWGDSEAQYYLGYLYHHGYGVFGDCAEAAQWYRKAAEQGNAKAQYQLGTLYEIGSGVPQDFGEASRWYRKSGEHGVGDAQYRLGLLYDQGYGVVEDRSEALKWYRKAAEKGQADAQCVLGAVYRSGTRGVVARDYSRATEWFRKAAEQGHARAKFWLGQLYYLGKGVEQDYEAAAGWFRNAAEQGLTRAQYRLGQLYYLGKEVEQDYEAAAEWFRKAARQGDRRAQYRLGRFYETGSGVEQDYEAAAKWYRKAAERDCARAQYRLGRLYENGRGVKQDYAIAVSWYRKAAEQDRARAQYRLGRLHENGRGVEQDYATAVSWYRKAAKQGHARAQYWLGQLYFLGKGVSQDYAAAAEWCWKAAELGLTDALDWLDSDDGIFATVYAASFDDSRDQVPTDPEDADEAAERVIRM